MAALVVRSSIMVTLNDPEVPNNRQPFLKPSRKLPSPLPEKPTQPLQRPELLNLEDKRLSFKSPPPLPHPKPLVRIRSEPVPCTTSRRSIFGDFWETSSSSLRRQRSSSCMMTITKPFEQQQPMLIHHSPLSSRSSSSSSIDDFHCQQRQLPPLPAPLQRLQKHSGVYPLLQPKSILRNNGCAAPKSASEEEDSPPAMITDSFNLTRTLHLPHTESSFCAGNESDSTTASSTDDDDDDEDDDECAELHQEHHPRKTVHFDPRVTVTELYSKEPRVWYTENDLERFKNETVAIAKQYLCKHPEQIPVYSQPALDPVTNTYRKKALFSMPALSTVSESDDEEDGDNDDNVVRRILVVDRNDCILGLFRRSLSIIFPKCNIQCVDSANAALALSQQQAFDIVIAEERLNRPLRSSCHELKFFQKDVVIPESRSVPDDIQSCSMSGSELFQELKNTGALLIGVVISKDEDSFAGGVADMVWSKPPPRMDAALKQQLIGAVKSKRNRRR